MNWNIPRTSGQALPISLRIGDRLFMVGANGSGKSALIQHLVSSNPNRTIRRISAHRQTWFNSGSIDFTPHLRREFDKRYMRYETQSDARWKDENAQQKQSAVFFDLVAEDNAQARSLRAILRQSAPKDHDNRALEDAIKAARESVPLFDQLNELLTLGTLTVSVENSNGEEIVARHGNTGESFSIAQMSDGERSAAIIAATVLTVEPETVLLIDEPERHLHRAIIEPFLSALFEQRKDCAFVISTHEIALPMAHPDARVLMVRSCEWKNDKAQTWDIEVLEPTEALPEELKRAILGAKRRIVFVEGTSDSLDPPLYNALFPGLSIVPTGSSGEVKNAVIGLRGIETSHDIEAFGLIDRDNKTEDDVIQLAEKHVFALDAYSVEALYYCSDAIAAVARRQAESLAENADTMIESAIQKAFVALNQNDLAKRMAERLCERRLRERVLSRLQSQKPLIGETNANSKITVCVESPYPDELKHFRKLVSVKDLNGLVARYPLRESSVFNAIAKALKCQTQGDYERMVVSRIREVGALAQKLKERIAPLSRGLEGTVKLTKS